MFFTSSKVVPAESEPEIKETREEDALKGEMYAILLHNLFRSLGGQRHPIVPTFEMLMKENVLMEYQYIPPSSTIIYVSHEWVGSEHPDPRGDQMYHLFLVPLLAYAASSDCLDIVRQTIAEIDGIADSSKRKTLISARVPKCGIVELGMTGGCTALNLAMMLSRTEIVSLLLDHGANPFENDVAGHDAFMMASIFGRTDNIKYWLSRFPDWNMERKNKLGGAALDMAVMMGRNRLELVKLLLESGASMDYRSSMVRELL